MFHYLEICVNSERNDHFPQVFQNLLKQIVLHLVKLPFFNSMIYVPFNLYFKEQSHVWKEITFSGDFHSNIPIVSPNYLMEIDMFKQFLFRISSIGFVNRIQFEEIWMTLLGVFSENLTILNSEARHEDDLKENIFLTQLVIKALTILLQKTRSSNYLFSEGGQFVKQSFGDRFELIRDQLNRKFVELTENSHLYNSLHYNEHFSDSLSVEVLQKRLSGIKSQKLSFKMETKIEMENSIDLYSCLHFLVDLYLQTVQNFAQNNIILFPILSEIARSCLLLSDMFVEKTHFHTLLQISNELEKIVDHYEDEILSQFVIVTLAKSYAVLSLSDETIERQKKLIIDQYFKDFFLPTRIEAVRSIKYLLNCPNLVSNKDLLSIWEYIGKHFDNGLLM